VNLNYFDTNISNSENYKYYNNFKIDVGGGFQVIDNLDLLQRYLEAIKNKNIKFIVLSTGSSEKDFISICKKFSFVKEIIIFCRNYKYNEHYLNEYPGYAKKVLTSIKEVYKYIRDIGSYSYISELSKAKSELFVFSYDLEQCPVISAYEYDNYYFLIHRAYAHFFGKMEDNKSLLVFEDSYFRKIKDYINYYKILKKRRKKN